ncbi:unnamed protein product [Heligmosomoides polygyrus]|uniref:Uncharacterized protein n=1 Tax=Heligmosomoides polygyrus TaxID=6339 RepID=A0A183G0A9_HELPZ|nr:unnamed protein product [Heligmosomoides polygyrus]
MTLFVSLERGGSIGPLWQATGTNGDADGDRSSKSMTNGTTADTGEMAKKCRRCSEKGDRLRRLLIDVVKQASGLRRRATDVVQWVPGRSVTGVSQGMSGFRTRVMGSH